MAGRQRLRVDGVERRHRDRAVVEGDPQRVLVDQRAARDVHDVRPLAHQRERVGVDEMACAWGRGRGEHHMVRARKQRIE